MAKSRAIPDRGGPDPRVMETASGKYLSAQYNPEPINISLGSKKEIKVTQNALGSNVKDKRSSQTIQTQLAVSPHNWGE